MLVEPSEMGDAMSGDEVVVRRIIGRRGRATGRVVAITRMAYNVILAYTSKGDAEFSVRDMRSGAPLDVKMPGTDLSIFKDGTVFLVDSRDFTVKEVIGHLGDPRIDERISLLLYERKDDRFPPEAVEKALSIPSTVLPEEIDARRDLRNLPFCTIDPKSAKDFDDAIYFDTRNHTLYVAIADVSHYVPFYDPIDLEARERGFTTYFPHKAFPMLPRELSEHICSLKPRLDRLAFVCRITLDMDTLEMVDSEFFEAVIHSRRRFDYDTVDMILESGGRSADERDAEILDWLIPLEKITRRSRKKRLEKGFDFRATEVRLKLDAEGKISSTTLETGTRSHSLIEECMLMANRSASALFSGECDAIFRVHDAPSQKSMSALLEELATAGLFVDMDAMECSSAELIREIQAEAKKAGLESEVDGLIIRSLKRAGYSCEDSGHFGLGFESYSHFTSPIRRYSDLILHHLIKARIHHDERKREYLLRNIESMAVRVSELERKASGAEMDFVSRKLARWALERVGERFVAEVVDIDTAGGDSSAKLSVMAEIDGLEAYCRADDLSLFERVEIELTHVDLARASVMAEVKGRVERGV